MIFQNGSNFKADLILKGLNDQRCSKTETFNFVEFAKFMALFGGDPRFVFNQVLYKMLLWYDAFIIPTLFISLLRNAQTVVTIAIPIPLFFFELIRLLLNSSHTNGDIPIYVVYLFICFLVFCLDIVCILFAGKSSFIIITVCAWAVFHAIQLLHSVAVYISFKKYQDAFYQFSQGHLQSKTTRKEEVLQVEADDGQSNV